MVQQAERAAEAREDAPRRRGRPRSHLSDEKRRQIVAAAIEVFGEQGYNGAAFAAVAERVGMTLPGMLHYFRRKTDLLLAILEERDEEHFAMAEAGAGGGWTRQREVLRGIVARNARRPAVVRLFTVLSAEALCEGHPAGPWFRARSERVAGAVAAALRDSQARGELRDDLDPVALAVEICAALEGLHVWWLRRPDQLDLVAQFDLYLERLERAVLA